MSGSIEGFSSLRCTRRPRRPTEMTSGDGDNPFPTRREFKRTRKCRDVLQQLESELGHVNRLSVMGKFAASLAHEIMQPTAAARNNASAALRLLENNSSDLAQVKEALGCVLDDLNRTADIIDRMRDHTRKAPPRRANLDLGETILQVIKLAKGTTTQNRISLQTQLLDRAFPVYADRTQVQQVVLNLIQNAVDAMSAADIARRELLISAEPYFADGVIVGVRDSGPGIDDQDLELIFEPFFTTKAHGTGIGLPICRAIIESHGGTLWAESNVPCGAAFWFTLPARGGARDSLRAPPLSFRMRTGAKTEPHIPL